MHIAAAMYILAHVRRIESRMFLLRCGQRYTILKMHDGQPGSATMQPWELNGPLQIHISVFHGCSLQLVIPIVVSLLLAHVSTTTQGEHCMTWIHSFNLFRSYNL